MPTATMSTKGQITLPKEMRDDLNLTAGAQVMFVKLGNGQYRILPRTGGISDLAGIFYDPNRKPMTIEEMNEAIAEGGAESGARGITLGVPGAALRK